MKRMRIIHYDSSLYLYNQSLFIKRRLILHTVVWYTLQFFLQVYHTLMWHTLKIIRNERNKIIRITNKNTTKPRKEKVYESESLKDGKFTEEELKQYGLSDDEISTILEYQALLPVLQEENENWIGARLLHSQLKVSRDFSTWIKKQIEDMELLENVDYKIGSPLKVNQNSKGGIDVHLIIWYRCLLPKKLQWLLALKAEIHLMS